MGKFIYRRTKSAPDSRWRARHVRSVDDLFDLLLDQLLDHRRIMLESEGFYRQRAQPVFKGLHTCREHKEHRHKIGHQSGEPSTSPCSRCGIRFSANLMKEGICRNCRSDGMAESEDDSPHDRGVTPSVSDRALRQAYRVLGCDEKDPDEIIKRRHRELAKEFHADRLSPEASSERIHNANERFCRAQEAYEIIMGTRNKPS